MNSDIEVIETFINCTTKILHRCKVCEHEWQVRPHDMLRHERCNCPKCAKINAAKFRIKQNYKIGQVVADKNRDIIITDVQHKDSNNNSHKIWIYKYKCNKCGFDCGKHYKNGILITDYWITQDHLNKGVGCACCLNRIIVPKINSIIANDEYNWMIKYFKNKEDAQKYSPNYSKKILLTCPDCGKDKYISLHTLNGSGFGCICSDGISYPEKFLYNVLEQLNIRFVHNKVFDWSKNTINGTKIYDFYIEQYSMIIETHGLQHYQSTSRGRSLKEEQQNDLFKKKLALDNGIKYYIELNCSKSNKEFIYRSICNSNMLHIFNCNSLMINIKESDAFATSNLVKQCAVLFNNGDTPMQIANKLQLNVHTVYRYLKKANDLEWCKYKFKGDI